MRANRVVTVIWGISLAVLLLRTADGETPATSLLRIDIDNYVPYNYDIFDPTKFASVPDRTTVPPGVPFGQILIIGDIVAVNGMPAKGVWVLRGTNLFLTSDLSITPPGYPPTGRLAIADLARSHIQDLIWEILRPDGTPIGSIMASGFARGTPPPGAPAEQTLDNLTITGGSGAFLGVRGQGGLIDVGSPRQASVTEAPSNRRLIGGAKRSYILKLLPTEVPEVVATASGPAVVHANDYSLVSAANPARAGEILTLFASGLGPTRPADAPLDAPQLVQSPITVFVGGASAEVLFAGAYPGAADRYQVNFRVPGQAGQGMVGLQLSQAWITGPEVRISLR